MTDTETKEKQLFCSFCGKNQSEVKKLIAGPSVYICDAVSYTHLTLPTKG